MQKWDYLHIICEEGRPRFINRQEIPNWQKGPLVFVAVNYLINKGWEMVDHPLAVNQLWISHRPNTHWFRRPRK